MHLTTARACDDTQENDGRHLPEEELSAGTAVGEHVIDYQCATGGFAAVYRAYDRIGQPVAVKVLHRHLALRPRVVTRFTHEARALARLRHDNIVEVRELGAFSDGRPYFVMEWLGETTLRDFLRVKGPLSPPEVLAIVGDIVAGLRAAHAVGVVHRDLKTKNIMVVPQGGWVRAKLIDFGIAKILEPDRFGLSEIATITTVVGTPYYMAPEQIMGRPSDSRTDIYALGVLIYELVTGEPPFRSDSRLELEDLHLHAPPPRVSEAAPVPAALDDVVARCLEKEPARRYATVDEVMAAARVALHGAAVPAAVDAPGLALYVEAHMDSSVDDVPEEAFDDVDGVVEEARRACIDAGMTLETELAVAVLAVAEEASGVRERMLRAARSLETRLRARPGRSPHVRVSVTLHAAPVTIRRRGARRELVGGELLRPGAWGQTRGEGLVVTSAFASGLALPPGIAVIAA